MAKKKSFIKQIGSRLLGKDISVSDERGWFNLTNSRFGSGAWSESDFMSQYSKSIYVFRCVKLISESISNMDYSLHRVKNTSGDVATVEMHPVLDLLAKPNPFQTFSQFIKITSTNKLLTGEAYLYKVRNNSGKIVELWNLRPDLMKAVSGDTEFVSHYEFSYNGKTQRYERDDIIHLFDTDPIDNRRGISALKPAQDRVQVEEYANEFQRNFFLNNARPDGLLRTEGEWTSEQKDEMRQDWNEKFQGRANNSKIAFLEGGTEYQQVSTNQKEMDFIESMKFTRDDILVAFGVPKGLITSDDVNLANAEVGMYSFNLLTIDPEMKQIVEGLNEQLIGKDFGKEFYLMYKSPVPEKREQMISEIKELTDKVITRNESRAMLGLEGAEGGDVLYNEFSKVPITVSASITADDEKDVKNLGKKFFHGKAKLYKQLKFKEDLTKTLTRKVLKQIKNSKKKSEDGEVQYISMFKTDDLKKQYEILINKGIDSRSSGFRQALNNVFDAQEKRIIKLVDELSKADGLAEDSVKEILDFDNEVEIFQKEMEQVYADISVDAGQYALKLIDKETKAVDDFILSQVLLKALKERLSLFAKSVNETTFKDLSKSIIEGVAEGEGVPKLKKRVKGIFNGISTKRATLIARTESTYASNSGFQHAYKQSTVVNGKEWISATDDRTRDEHLAINGEIVGVFEEFSNGLEYPQEPNCRCVIAPAIIKK